MTQSEKAPTRDELVEAIKAAGSDNTEFFGFPEKEDGLYLQQEPTEYADFVHYMATEGKPATLALDIGVASGGQTKFLRDYYSVEKTIVVDLGVHPNFKHWERIKPTVNTEIVLEIIADSHAPHVREKLMPFAGKIDFAFIDGDHSYRGLKQDLFLASELLIPGAVVVLHDTLEVPDCHKVFLELARSPRWELLRNFDDKFGISVWKFGPGWENSSTSFFNRKWGWGSL